MRAHILKAKSGCPATSSVYSGASLAASLTSHIQSNLMRNQSFKAVHSRVMPVTAWFRYNTVRGNRSGWAVLSSRLGPARAASLALRLQWELLRNPPFKEMNLRRKPTTKEWMSQQQMAPVVVLYQLLREDGESQNDSLSLLSALIQEVGIGFMRFSLPVMRRDQFLNLSPDGRHLMLSRLTNLFVNAESTLSLDGDQEFRLDIHHCHFAHYSRALGVPELGSLFCQADKPYFERHQPDVVFFRSQTLAENQLPCDFRFQWR